MSYEVRCECGKAYPVGAADAVVSFSCACGKTVDVPPLHMLRTRDGEAAVPILVRVRGLIANGQLPGPRVCVLCRLPTQGMARVGLECEPTPGEGGSEFGSGSRLSLRLPLWVRSGSVQRCRYGSRSARIPGRCAGGSAPRMRTVPTTSERFGRAPASASPYPRIRRPFGSLPRRARCHDEVNATRLARSDRFAV